MLRIEHNREYGVDRQPEELVNCTLHGYGELSQYDPGCAACWLGHVHNWAHHDNAILNKRAGNWWGKPASQREEDFQAALQAAIRALLESEEVK